VKVIESLRRTDKKKRMAYEIILIGSKNITRVTM